MINATDKAKEPIVDANIIRSGNLDVGDGHKIYWVDWGNKNVKEPIFFLHGGPGDGFTESAFNKFNPLKHRVVFHDQRGSGRSTPFASIKNNTTKDLISDITMLKNHLNINKISLYGGSWGSTLALLYAIANPKDINKMLLSGIFLGRNVDNDFYLHGKVASHFPEAWQQFCSIVPKLYQNNISEYYKKMLFGDNEKNRKQFAKEWMKYESSIAELDYQPTNIEKDLTNFASSSLAYLEAHYILNNCFIEENYIINNASKLSGIQQIIIVQGRYDFVCMPSAAYDLDNALGENSKLHFVMSGHAGSDIVKREVLHAYISMLW